MYQTRKYASKLSPIAIAISGLLTTPFTSVTALAQAGMLEEVIVTARKREESLQETPVAVTAISGEQLQEAGLNDLTDLDKVVPNLVANVGSGGGSTQLFIRGVGARNSGANFDGGVAIYQDGVYLSRPDGSILESVDVQSIQVLRGPQGTLFGKNSTGGAILYTTNKPVDVFEGTAEVNVGNHERFDTQATVNVPLMEDALYSRASFYTAKRDGLMQDQYGRKFSDVDRYGGTLQLRALPGDSVVVDLLGQYSKINQNPRGQKCQQALGVVGSGWQAAAQNTFIIKPSTGLTIQENCKQSSQLDQYKFLSALTGDIPAKYQAETTGTSANIDWEINDSLSLKSISAWRHVEAGQQDDVYYAGIPLVLRLNYGYDIAEPRKTDWYSQEFQLTGAAFDDSVDYVFGLFAANEKTDAGTAAGIQGPFFGTIFGANNAYYTAEATELLTDNTSYAAFSQVDWAFADAWNLTLGLRYTWEERNLDRNTYNADVATLSTGAPVVPGVANGFYTFPDGPDSFNNHHGFVPNLRDKNDVTNSDWNPMGSIQYLFEDAGPVNTGSTYFTIATGFLSGGLSESLDFDGNIPEYDPEEVINYELGTKLDMLDHTLRVNTALFYTDYKNRQLTSIGVNPNTGSVASRTINAKKSSITGWELETTWLPIEALQLTFNFVYNEGDIEEFDDFTIVTANSTDLQGCTEDIPLGSSAIDLCPVDRTHEDLPNLPKQIYYLAAQYTWETNIGEVVGHLDAAYSEDVNTCFDYSSCSWRNGKGLENDTFSLNARLTWYSPSTDWRVTAWGDNLTDYDYKAGGNALIGTTQTMSYEWNIPRTYGVEVAYTW